MAVVEDLDDKVACVIIEPVMFDLPQREFLSALRRACEHVGALLVFDEMWTGFRLALGGAQQFFDVRADLPASRRPSPTACRSACSAAAPT